MALRQGRSLQHYLSLRYPFHVATDAADQGFVISFPDLPGCITQSNSIDEIGELAEDARRAWIESEYEDGRDIPLPSYHEDYSGKFNLRLPRSLHRALAAGAERDGVSLNQYVVSLLSRKAAEHAIERRLDAIERRLAPASMPEVKIAEERARYDSGRRAKKPSPRKRSPRRSS